MRRFLIPLIAVLALPTAVNSFPFRNEKCANYKYSPSQIFKNKVNSVVVVKTSESQGSGFVVKHDKNSTYILTNAHVVGNKERVDVKWSDESKDSAQVIGNLGGYELDNDLALLKVFGKKGKPLKLIDKIPEIGSDAVVIGAPSGLEFSVTKGVVSQIREKGDFVQIDAPVNPGNSGGPVFNYAGCVIGVVTFKAGEGSEGLNFAIGSNLISKFIENPYIDEDAIYKQALSRLTPPPLPIEGPFQPFNQAGEYAAEYSEQMTTPYFQKGYRKKLEDDKKGNDKWITLTLITDIRKDKKPYSRRFMVDPDSLRKDGNWFKVRTLMNALNLYSESYRDIEGKQYKFYDWSFGGGGSYKINCKEQKIKDLLNSRNGEFTLTTSGWFLTNNERYYGQIRYDLDPDDNQEHFSKDYFNSRSSRMESHLWAEPKYWITEEKAINNKREVTQIKNTALFNYFCGE